MRIDEMQAGREMDALIAEKVMKIPLYWHKYISVDGFIKCGPYLNSQDDGGSVNRSVFYYSTDISRAWEVVEKIKELKGKIAVSFMGGTEWCCDIYLDDITDIQICP